MSPFPPFPPIDGAFFTPPEVSVHGHRSASRLVSLRDQTLTGLLTEELRIRARDAAFERALGQLVSAG